MSIVKDFVEQFNKLPSYVIEIGVISANTTRKETVRVGVTNAELMYIHENGSPLQHIPARPILQMTIDYANKNLLSNTIDKALQAYVDSNFNVNAATEVFEKLCLRMENYARKIIYSNDGRLAPNSPAVAKRKGGNHPLFDTGQLARSITCRLVIS